MSKLKTLQNFDQDFITFRNKANIHLGHGHYFHYNSLYTGVVENIDTLFLSINLGYNDRNWGQNPGLNRDIYQNTEIKFKNEDMDMASAISDIIFNNQNGDLANCAETYFTSVFATPGEAELYQQINMLSPELKLEYYRLVDNYQKFILSQLNPRRIICIGVGVFDAVSSILGLSKKLIAKDGNNRLLLKSEVNGINIYGVRHLTGSRSKISPEGKAMLRNFFKSNP